MPNVVHASLVSAVVPRKGKIIKNGPKLEFTQAKNGLFSGLGT